MTNTILFPSSFFDCKRVDEDLEREYKAVIETGEYDVLLFSYDDWFNNGCLKLYPKVESDVNAVYRGWMMQPAQYLDFFGQLRNQHVCLITTPEMYEKMHVFPNIYPCIERDTARILTFPLHENLDVAAIKESFGKFMVKDYVKSVKGTEFPTFFDQTTSQEEFDHWMEIFYKYRANLLTGGICIKEYLNLKRYAGKTNEFRVFYLNHQIMSACRNSLQGGFTPEPPSCLIEKYRNLESVFYTLDYAELEDGTWRIIEAGDGSVSGLSDGQDYSAFFRAMYHCLN